MSETLKLHAFSSKLYTFYVKTPHLKLCLHVPNTDLPLASGEGCGLRGLWIQPLPVVRHALIGETQKLLVEKAAVVETA